MGINSKTKGKVGEREWAEFLRSFGFEARRGVQYSGNPEAPDVVCNDLPFHWEVKRVEKLNIDQAMDQAKRDCGNSIPVVSHRKNRSEWLITIQAEQFLKLVTEHFKTKG